MLVKGQPVEGAAIGNWGQRFSDETEMSMDLKWICLGYIYICIYVFGYMFRDMFGYMFVYIIYV